MRPPKIAMKKDVFSYLYVYYDRVRLFISVKFAGWDSSNRLKLPTFSLREKKTRWLFCLVLIHVI